MRASTERRPLIRRYGENGWLLEVADSPAALALWTELLAHPGRGQRQVVTGARTVYVEFVSEAARESAVPDLEQRVAAAARTTATQSDTLPLLKIPVVYDGADLPGVARGLGLTENELVARHTGTGWRVAFGGFAPGFGYLVPTDSRWGLSVSRRSTARTTVPAGAVALADGYSGVYPRVSPGGWQLIGRTNLRLWVSDRPSPALLGPGRRVMFHSVPELPAEMVDSAESGNSTAIFAAAGQEAIEILRTGILTTAQDLGRPGRAALGVPLSGAADRRAALLANRLVGNGDDAVVLETTLGRLRFRALRRLQMTVTGPSAAVMRTTSIQKIEYPVDEPFGVEAGDLIEIGRPTAGLRNYVAVRGGWTFPDRTRQRRDGSVVRARSGARRRGSAYFGQRGSRQFCRPSRIPEGRHRNGYRAVTHRVKRPDAPKPGRRVRP